MNQLRRNAIALCAIVIHISPSFADDCSMIHAAITSADNDFSDIRGPFDETHEGTNYYKTNASFSSAPNCLISFEPQDNKWSLRCNNGFGKSRVEVVPHYTSGLLTDCQVKIRSIVTSYATTYTLITNNRKLAVLTEINRKNFYSLTISKP